MVSLFASLLADQSGTSTRVLKHDGVGTETGPHQSKSLNLVNCSICLEPSRSYTDSAYVPGHDPNEIDRVAVPHGEVSV